jgi:hypothetical protein
LNKLHSVLERIEDACARERERERERERGLSDEMPCAMYIFLQPLNIFTGV